MYAKGDPFFIQCVGEKKMGQRNRRGCDKTYFDMHATTTQSKELANVKPDGQKLKTIPQFAETKITFTTLKES